MRKAVLIITLLLSVLGVQSSRGQRFLTDEFSKVDSVPDMVYGSAVNYQGEQEPLYVDFYEPHGDRSTERPLLIYAHGGGFTGGTRKWPSIRMICEKMAGRGYAVASISYRVDPRFNYLKCDTNRKVMTDAMHDMRAAIRFFKAKQARFRIDTSHIFVSGESAGAVTAMMAGYVDQTKELKAYPMTAPENVEGDSGTPGHSSAVKAVLCLCGMIYDTTAMDSPQEPPLFWAHGSSDPLIPFSWADEVPERAAHIGLPYQKVVFEGATHCPWYYGLPGWPLYLDSLVNYMSHFLYPLITGKEAPALSKARPALRVANVLQNGMVIQQEKPFRVWGFSYPGDTVVLQADWLPAPREVYAGEDGRWSGELEAPAAVPGNFDPHSITVMDPHDTIRLSDLLIGEVWICAGQSNMDMRVKEIKGWYQGVLNYKEEMAAADYPAIRVFTESANFSLRPQYDTRGKWETCSPETAGNFSAVAYFFGRKLFEELKIPVGLVVAAAAGANAQSFTPEKTLLEDTLLKRVYLDPYKPYLVSQAKVDSLDFFTKVTRPTLIYNGMIHPLENLSVRGFTWYQGESNYTDKGNYTRLASAMIRSWRNNFNQGDLPFYLVQIAPYVKNANRCSYILGSFWEAQEALLTLKNTGMALSMDVGEGENIHPRDKKPVGERLARLALHRDYGRRDIMDQGPQMARYKIKKNGTVKIFFKKETVGPGLATRDGQPAEYFSVAGRDRVFYPATVKIAGNKILVHSSSVARPVAVRYGFTNDAITNFENKEGLPAFPFRTDHWTVCAPEEH